MLKLHPDQAQKWIDMAVHAVRKEGEEFELYVYSKSSLGLTLKYGILSVN